MPKITPPLKKIFKFNNSISWSVNVKTLMSLSQYSKPSYRLEEQDTIPGKDNLQTDTGAQASLPQNGYLGLFPCG